MFSKIPEIWINTVFDLTRKLIAGENNENKDKVMDMELDALRDYILNTAIQCFSMEAIKKDLIKEFDYGIPKWLTAPQNSLFENHKLSKPLVL